LQPEKFFNPPVYFVEINIPNNENTPEDGARGYEPICEYCSLTRRYKMAKKKAAKKKATKKKKK